MKILFFLLVLCSQVMAYPTLYIEDCAAIEDYTSENCINMDGYDYQNRRSGWLVCYPYFYSFNPPSFDYGPLHLWPAGILNYGGRYSHCSRTYMAAWVEDDGSITAWKYFVVSGGSFDICADPPYQSILVDDIGLCMNAAYISDEIGQFEVVMVDSIYWAYASYVFYNRSLSEQEYIVDQVVPSMSPWSLLTMLDICRLLWDDNDIAYLDFEWRAYNTINWADLLRLEPWSTPTPTAKPSPTPRPTWTYQVPSWAVPTVTAPPVVCAMETMRMQILEKMQPTYSVEGDDEDECQFSYAIENVFPDVPVKDLYFPASDIGGSLRTEEWDFLGLSWELIRDKVRYVFLILLWIWFCVRVFYMFNEEESEESEL